MTQCARFTVQGTVQGVGFRASTMQQARALALTGWVHNRPDGSVEVLACGETDALERLHEWLWAGPGAARVTQVERADAPEEVGCHATFQVG